MIVVPNDDDDDNDDDTSPIKLQSQLIGCGSSFLRVLDHTQRLTTVGRTPLHG